MRITELQETDVPSSFISALPSDEACTALITANTTTRRRRLHPTKGHEMSTVEEDLHGYIDRMQAIAKQGGEHASEMAGHLDRLDILAKMHEPTADRRKLGPMYDAAYYAYDSCDYQNGNACARKFGCTFAFRGSDDIDDWIANIGGAFWTRNVDGLEVHGGFYDEFSGLLSKTSTATGNNMEYDIDNCGSSTTFVGHSLGGAMATMAFNYFKAKTGWLASVYTFGSPMVYKNFQGPSTCRRTRSQGMRIFHEGDPVAGRIGGAMTTGFGLSHQQEGQEIYRSCADRSWWGWCDRYSYQMKDAGCSSDSGWFDYTVNKHMMGDGYIEGGANNFR